MPERKTSAFLRLACQKEARAQLIIESITDYAIIMLDPDGCIESWNAGAERIKGYKAEEILGRHFSLFSPPADIVSGKCDQALRTAAAQGRHEDEGWRVRKEGTWDKLRIEQVVTNLLSTTAAWAWGCT